MEIETLSALGSINEQLIATRYERALGTMKVPCLYTAPKQCFVAAVDPATNKVVNFSKDKVPYILACFETC